MLRHDTTTRFTHPDPLRVGPVLLERCDGDPFTDIQDGDSVFGWMGDQRLQLYFNPKFMTWELWRLEYDNEYRLEAAWNARKVATMDIVPTILQFMVHHDQFAGFDAAKSVNSYNDAVDAAKQKEWDAEMDQAAEAVVWAMEKDGLI